MQATNNQPVPSNFNQKPLTLSSKKNTSNLTMALMNIQSKENKENATPNKKVTTVRPKIVRIKHKKESKISKRNSEPAQIIHHSLQPKDSESNKEYQTEEGKEELLEIWKSLKEKENLDKYDYGQIVELQTDINAKMRSILVDWLISVHQQLRLKRNTLFLCINIIDRYISLKQILRCKFQLLGITALFISAKYEEISYPHISYFVEFTAKTFTKEEILEMENQILNALNFELNLPFSNYFFEILSIFFKFDLNEKHQGLFLLEGFLLKIECNCYTQSEIALSVCYILLKLSGKWEYEENENLVEYLYYSDDSLFNKIIQCSKEIFALFEYQTEIKKNFKAVFVKYGY